MVVCVCVVSWLCVFGVCGCVGSVCICVWSTESVLFGFRCGYCLGYLGILWCVCFVILVRGLCFYCL